MYDRIGRYEYIKPDSTTLVLIDSITGTDTTRSTYTGSSFTSCSFSIVPSIIIKPIMSANTIRAWADVQAVIVRDSLDTCIVRVPDNADTLLYSIDIARGIIFNLYWNGPSQSVTHQYLYGYDRGIYFPRKVCCSGYDTTIEYGGYIFSDIRINGEPVSSVTSRLRSGNTFFAIHPIGSGGDRVLFSGAESGMKISAFDLAGRSLFETFLQKKSDVLHLNRLCGGRGCSNGPIVLRGSGGPIGAASFSTVIVR